jgi:murein L,D-transpeptidase YafK
MKYTLIALVIMIGLTGAESFKAEQLKFGRVKNAFEEKDSLLKSAFENIGIEYPPKRIFIRIFKRERVLELWATETGDEKFKLAASYPLAGFSGNLGPKRMQGDSQIPEGFYNINVFNPTSNFHLSLGISYPNKSDKILGSKDNLGGEIFIHGSFVTIGCIPITDDKIKELYIIAVMAKSNGQPDIPVHIFPFHMDSAAIHDIKSEYRDANLIKFWGNLKIGYDFFEKKHKLPIVDIDNKGTYLFR